MTASDYDLKIAVTHRPGQFMTRGDDLARVWPAEKLTSAVANQLRAAFVVGRLRVAPQDVEYAIDQLVEIAVRALSAAVNDPFTAMNCIDWLGVGISRLAEKKIPPEYFHDSTGELRIRLMKPVTFDGAVGAAFNQIRQSSGGVVAVQLRLLEVLAVIAEHTQDPDELRALKRQADMIHRSNLRLIHEQEDLRDLEQRYRLLENLPGSEN